MLVNFLDWCLYKKKDEIDDQENITQNDEVADSILRLVEMVILPHLEVLERIEKQGGNVQFINIWDKHFEESLKTEVKNRDGWKCVICDSDKDLHVHHKIPRKFGGVHHMNNLVTLCASCHKVIETADIKQAFKKCFSNFQRNKYNQIDKKQYSEDKSKLKNEVETSLDSILMKLNNKDEVELVHEVTEIINRLEIIFYE